MSDRKQASNRRNAARSTGPKSAEGKSSSSRNALRHGILGSGLLLGDEDPAEYDALFQSLVQDLRPQGALELIHLERIATAIWRQRRLIRAETAAVAFRQAASDTRKMLTETLGVPDSVRIKDPSLQPLDDNELQKLVSYRKQLQELEEKTVRAEISRTEDIKNALTRNKDLLEKEKQAFSESYEGQTTELKKQLENASQKTLELAKENTRLSC